MYKALYRKYRPTTFSEVAGQEHVTETLKNQLRAGRLGHAYLFTGSRGTGKTTCAKILAKAVHCENPRDGDPCGVCESCKNAESESSVDVLEIDAASNNGVENIRELREQAHYVPAGGKYRVYIIDEVHMLSVSAFNALLKTLEEPPERTLFILATTEVHKLPATVLSRCQRFDFKRIPPEIIAERLLTVAGKEGIDLRPEAALLIARLADGALRDALSLLDVCAGGGGTVDEAAVSAAAGLAGREYLHRLSDAVLAESPSEALAIADELHRASVDMQRLCEELMRHFRDLMICKSADRPESLVAVSGEDLRRLREKAERLPLGVIFHALAVLEETLNKMNHGSPKRTETELALVRLCRPGREGTPDAMERRLARLERTVESLAARLAGAPAAEGEEAVSRPTPAPRATAPEPETPSVPKETGPAKPAGPDYENARPCGFWNRVVDRIHETDAILAAALAGAKAYVSDDWLLIDTGESVLRQKLNEKPENRTRIRDAAHAVTGKRFRLGPYASPTRRETSAEPEDPMKELCDRLAEGDLLRIEP